MSLAKISQFAYSTHCPSDACADKCPLCLVSFLETLEILEILQNLEFWKECISRCGNTWEICSGNWRETLEGNNIVLFCTFDINFRQNFSPKMPVDLKPMRYAHSEGHTDVCYDDSGRLEGVISG